MVDGVYVLHGIHNDPSHHLHIFEAADEADRPTLHQDVALGEKLECFKGVSVWPDQSLSSLYESLFVSHE